MDIPNEAWRAAEKADRVASESERVTAIVAAAAPHIARAAQVAILREVAEEFNGRAGGGYANPLVGGLEEATWGWAEGRLLERANELEAGA